MREKSKLSVKRQQKLFLLGSTMLLYIFVYFDNLFYCIGLVDDHICVAVTGMLFDAQAVISVARKICVQYRNSFQAPIPVERLSSELAGVMNAQTRKVNARPLGVCLLVAGADEHLGHQVYRVDPEGNLDAWKAVCIGRGSADVMSLLSSEVLSFDDTPVDVAWAHVKGVLMRNQKKLVVDTDVNSSAEVDVCVCHRDSGSGMLSWEYYTCNLVRTS
jgi:20S proteasome alpha/beta subunit